MLTRLSTRHTRPRTSTGPRAISTENKVEPSLNENSDDASKLIASCLEGIGRDLLGFLHAIQDPCYARAGARTLCKQTPSAMYFFPR